MKKLPFCSFQFVSFLQFLISAILLPVDAQNSGTQLWPILLAGPVLLVTAAPAAGIFGLVVAARKRRQQHRKGQDSQWGGDDRTWRARVPDVVPRYVIIVSSVTSANEFYFAKLS